MTWFKFLADGATGPFSGYRWPPPRGSRDPGAWAASTQPLDPCRSGLHVCREVDLPFWLHEELYLVDVDGQVLEYDSFVLVPRARLLRRVEAWGPGSAYRFSCECAWRVRDLTAAALRRRGRPGDADRLLGCSAITELGEAARRVDAGDGGLAGYAADAAAFAAGAEAGTGWASAAATAGFVAATAARVAAGPADGRTAWSAERARQAGWLAGLAPAVG